MNIRTTETKKRRLELLKQKFETFTFPVKIIDIKPREEEDPIKQPKTSLPRFKNGRKPSIFRFLILFRNPKRRGRKAETVKIWVNEDDYRLEKAGFINMLEDYATTLQTLLKNKNFNKHASLTEIGKGIKRVDVYCRSRNIRIQLNQSAYSDDDLDDHCYDGEFNLLSKRPPNSRTDKLFSFPKKLISKKKHYDGDISEFDSADELLSRKIIKIGKSSLEKNATRVDPGELKNFVNHKLANRIEMIIQSIQSKKKVSKSLAFRYLTLLENEIKQFVTGTS